MHDHHADDTDGTDGAGKVKPLCFSKHHVMKAHARVEVQLHAFLNSALDGAEWSRHVPRL